MVPESQRRPARDYAIVLSILTIAFLGRVAGEFSVAFLGVEFLPPLEAWDSGLLKYSALLAAQIVILGVQITIVRHLWRGAGRFAGARPRLGIGLKRFSIVYFAVMFVRYVVTVWLPVDLPWSPATIPIYFHWVLALHVYVLSRYYRALPLLGTRT